MDNGQWTGTGTGMDRMDEMDRNGLNLMDNGQWTMDDGQWTMDRDRNGQDGRNGQEWTGMDLT